MDSCSCLVADRCSEDREPDIWTPPSPKPDSPDLFMTLPPELRNVVYAQVVPTDVYTHISTTRSTPEPALFSVSRQVRKEVMQMYYAANQVVVAFSLDPASDLPGLVRKLRNIVANCGKIPFRYFYFRVHGPVEGRILALLPLVALVHETGVKFATESYRTYY
ncbi:hypothetical protein LTR85_012042 [Meristemomyces frigidus]|nr:hypothetical protein LTR85_012042 [Meristemomyces frigidus]